MGSSMKSHTAKATGIDVPAPRGEYPPGAFVPETRFGVWFLGTETWNTRVLSVALSDLEALIPDRNSKYPIILDVGCGRGRSFPLLAERFDPDLMIGVDVDEELLDVAAADMQRLNLPVKLIHSTSCDLPLDAESVDMIFCHQTFHHLVDHDAAIAEFHRVLKPGGLLLFAESTAAYIHSWIIRYLFRHPMDVQKTADGYLQLIRDAGFEVPEASISLPYLWWSRPDLGIMETWFGRRPPPDRVETLVNAVAIRQ